MVWNAKKLLTHTLSTADEEQEGGHILGHNLYSFAYRASPLLSSEQEWAVHYTVGVHQLCCSGDCN